MQQVTAMLHLWTIKVIGPFPCKTFMYMLWYEVLCYVVDHVIAILLHTLYILMGNALILLPLHL